MKKGKHFIMLISIVLIFVSFIGSKGEVVENLGIPAGVGIDINETSSSIDYTMPVLIYLFEGQNQITGDVNSGRALSLGKSRETRQLKSGKRFLVGLNKVYVFSEKASRCGLRSFIDINFINPSINDRAMCVVSEEKAEEILGYKIKGYPTSSDYLQGMVKNLEQFNFFSNQYTFTDVVVRVDAEGRNLLLPYVEMKEGTIITTGLAIFKGDKMIAKSDMDETRVINILKENNVTGVLTLQKDSKMFTDFYAKSKRKVECTREGDKYKFVINLNLKGSIITNELYKGALNDAEEIKRFEDDMKYYVERKSVEIINKIKREYKVDVLDLGRVAAAKYGRGTDTDWNEVISNSEITVKVKVKVDTEGRGTY